MRVVLGLMVVVSLLQFFIIYRQTKIKKDNRRVLEFAAEVLRVIGSRVDVEAGSTIGVPPLIDDTFADVLEL
jgi:hypothetical protein